MFGSWVPTIKGFVRGYAAVAVIMAAGMVGVLFSEAPNSLKLIFGVLLALPLIAISKRIGWGTEEGSTDLEITPQAIRITNIPLSTFAHALAVAIEGYGKLRHPIPRPVGEVRGSPAKETDLILNTKVALPPGVEITDTPLVIPQGAIAIEGQEGVGVRLSERGDVEKIDE